MLIGDKCQLKDDGAIFRITDIYLCPNNEIEIELSGNTRYKLHDFELMYKVLARKT